MIDILFSHSYYYPLDAKQWKNKTPFPPLGTIYAAALMRKNGYTTDLFDTNLRDNPYDIEKEILEKKPRFLVLYDDGFNYLTKMCLTTMREAAFEMIRIGKSQNCIVIVNSSDATDHYEKYLFNGADYIIQGEGEIALSELIEKINKNEPTKTLNSIVYTENGEVKINSKKEVLKQLDELPLPAWDLVDISSYRKIWQQGGNEFTLNIATTRGCPYKCNWCAKPIYGNRYNSHSPQYIVEHIKYLQKEYQVKKFWMCDDIFGLKPGWVQEFNHELRKQVVSLNYYIQSRVDLLLQEDTIDALAESGLQEVWVGAESGSQSILDAMDKGTSVEQIYKATEILKQKDIKVAFFIQFGYLGETKEDIDKTIQMIKKLLPDDLGISVSYPLPGTKFYEKVKDDLKLKANWTDSHDLAMMFRGTFNSKYYRNLYKYTHKEYRKSQGFYFLKQFLEKPRKTTPESFKRIVHLVYNIPVAFLYRQILNRMEHLK